MCLSSSKKYFIIIFFYSRLFFFFFCFMLCTRSSCSTHRIRTAIKFPMSVGTFGELQWETIKLLMIATGWNSSEMYRVLFASLECVPRSLFYQRKTRLLISLTSCKSFFFFLLFSLFVLFFFFVGNFLHLTLCTVTNAFYYFTSRKEADTILPWRAIKLSWNFRLPARHLITHIRFHI